MTAKRLLCWLPGAHTIHKNAFQDRSLITRYPMFNFWATPTQALYGKKVLILFPKNWRWSTATPQLSGSLSPNCYTIATKLKKND